MKKFLILVFDIPRKKAYLRVKVWRELTRVGAKLLYRSHWTLPYNGKNLIEMKKICEKIKKFGGKAEVIKGEKIN
jgi:Na+-translocating ferredoxin:NAD+ oxidoreductase RnfG subunit